jgi:hypothetical protein
LPGFQGLVEMVWASIFLAVGWPHICGKIQQMSRIILQNYFA